MLKRILSALAITAVASLPVQANLITNGDFEEDQLNGRGWKVFSEIDGWTTTLGAGIEIQRNTIVRAQSGNQYVELDSHDFSGGGQHNSGMTQGIDTVVGQDYVLSFYYMPRTNKSRNDNGLGIFWDEFDGDYGSFDPTNEIFAIEDITRNVMPDWTEYTFEFEATSNFMALSFAGQGRNNSLGAFIDNVSLQAKVPEPGTVALFGLGLVGLFAARRKK